MLKKCPYCRASIIEDSKIAYCPYCGSELPKESTDKEQNYSILKADPKKVEVKHYTDETNKKTFSSAYKDYSTNRAYMNMFICPIIAVIVALVSIIGAFYNIRMLFGLILSAVFVLVGFINYVYYKSSSN